MTRIAPLEPAKAPWYLRPFFWNQRRKYGAALAAALLWARAPRLFLGVALLYGMIDRRSSPIDRLRRHFAEDAVVELTGLVAFQNLSSKFNAALAVPAQGFCRPPPRAM